jgi:cyclopropane fatty-acyl-phospholipid synthase-like methyltransferase
MVKKLKQKLGALPLIGPILRSAYKRTIERSALQFRSSSQYWEDRYKLGGTSGSGSYGRLAEFKAEVLNDFVARNNIHTVAEFGCGDGAQLGLAKYPHYIGFDVAPTSIRLCREKFPEASNFAFHTLDSAEYENLEPVDLALSLDVIYHLIEEEAFSEYMTNLFRSSNRFVIIYAYDFHKTYESKHEKGRNFTKWISVNEPTWELIERVPNKYPYDPSNPTNTSQSDFFVYARRS